MGNARLLRKPADGRRKATGPQGSIGPPWTRTVPYEKGEGWSRFASAVDEDGEDEEWIDGG